jgi:DNA-binding transcriptional MocR family regulator
VAEDLGIETDVVSEQLQLLEENGFIYLVPADAETSEQTVRLP